MMFYQLLTTDSYNFLQLSISIHQNLCLQAIFFIANKTFWYFFVFEKLLTFSQTH